jgi:hypothetical protein
VPITSTSTTVPMDTVGARRVHRNILVVATQSSTKTGSSGGW